MCPNKMYIKVCISRLCPKNLNDFNLDFNKFIWANGRLLC